MSKARAIARAQERSDTGRFARWIGWSALVFGCALFLMSGAFAAVGDDQLDVQPGRDADEIITGSIPKDASAGTNVRMQFIQIDGPLAGHVKVVLTPDDRALTPEEARTAARQAFLETMNDPSFMDDLKIVTIVVHRFPDLEDPTVDFSVRFRAEGDGKWSVQDAD